MLFGELPAFFGDSGNIVVWLFREQDLIAWDMQGHAEPLERGDGDADDAALQIGNVLRRNLDIFRQLFLRQGSLLPGKLYLFADLNIDCLLFPHEPITPTNSFAISLDKSDIDRHKAMNL